MMHGQVYTVGQRLSLSGQTCTVRYSGPVKNKEGEWLGVEWNDTTRGKNNGSHNGIQYFTCSSTSLSAASFLRPSQSWDKPQTFLSALRSKYMAEDRNDGAKAVVISGKEAEEVGFQKFARRQAALHGIQSLVLDSMCIRHESIENAEIESVCSNITSLDLSGNLFSSWGEIADLCLNMPKLQDLVLDGNRFTLDKETVLKGLRSLSLANTLLDNGAVDAIVKLCCTPKGLVLARNELPLLSLPDVQSVEMLDLSGNRFTAVDSLVSLQSWPNLREVILKHNQISRGPTKAIQCAITSLDLTCNSIDTWKVLDDLTFFMPQLRRLRLSDNPILANCVDINCKALTAEDGYMLAIARLPNIESLNYSVITAKERLNAETYYLSQIAFQLRKAHSKLEALSQHPQYVRLCQEHGEPVLEGLQTELLPGLNGLNGRLCLITFSTGLSQSMESIQIPKSFTTYMLYGIIGKRLGLMPLTLQLVFETGENELLANSTDEHVGLECWDSSSEDSREDSTKITRRGEYRLQPSTQPIASFIECDEARIRVELKVSKS